MCCVQVGKRGTGPLFSRGGKRAFAAIVGGRVAGRTTVRVRQCGKHEKAGVNVL